jgi:hypothetical protein
VINLRHKRKSNLKANNSGQVNKKEVSNLLKDNKLRLANNQNLTNLKRKRSKNKKARRQKRWSK